MAAPAKAPSRWGSYLQQAVASVESSLDTILAEGGDDASKSTSRPAPTSSAAGPTKVELGVSRNGSNSKARPSDRLQERLRNITAKNAQKTGYTTPSSSTPSRTTSPLTGAGSPRQSLDVVTADRKVNSTTTAPPTAAGTPRQSLDVVAVDHHSDGNIHSTTSLELGNQTTELEKVSASVPSVSLDFSSPSTESAAETHGLLPASHVSIEGLPRLSIDSTRSSLLRSSIDQPRSSIEESLTHPILPIKPKTPAEYEALLSQLQSDFQKSELQRQEEVHEYVEKIDALHAKVQYLAKDSAEAARKTGESVPSGTLEKKLADKEQQIALLMEEGQSLSKKEMSHLTTIKKLRAKLGESSREVVDAKDKQERAQREVSVLSDRIQRAELSEKKLLEKTRQASQLQRELDALKVEKEVKDNTISELNNLLEDTIEQQKQVETKIANEALDIEKKRVAKLEEDLSDLKIQKQLVDDRAKARIQELEEEKEREAEQARVTSLAMKEEQRMLENRVELYRARAEEASSGETGDALAKQLRQYEQLQAHYAQSQEHSQLIQASLDMKLITLEKEKNEALAREKASRQKARDISLKAKRDVEDLEELRSLLPTLQHEIAEQKLRVEDLLKRAEAAESALIQAKTAFDEEKQTWKSELNQRIEEERRKVEEAGQRRGSSPVASTRRGLTTEFLGMQNMSLAARRTSNRGGSIIASDLPTPLSGRRPSVQPHYTRSGSATPIRQDSNLSAPTLNGGGPDALSIQMTEDDYFDKHRSSSPQETINDMVSTSTAAAGPSVQLVERMSSKVRKLELEKQASKDEAARLEAQRDEARAELKSLDHEIKAKRDADKKIEKLKEDMADLTNRYDHLLEMHGEKVERVKELEEDIVELKLIMKGMAERVAASGKGM